MTEDDRLCANEGELVPLPCKTSATVVNCELLRIIDNCAKESWGVILDFARAGKINSSVLYCFGWLLYDFADAKTISVFDRKGTSS